MSQMSWNAGFTSGAAPRRAADLSLDGRNSSALILERVSGRLLVGAETLGLGPNYPKA